ncbi:hypothetical protein [Sphingomonas vulcanisoli]|uniref:hypothetical protein n=1 Tax=Sphingomonas vulcanisoli TaxID=1658060 RepID=UPI001422B408|nr:hypothetical protein [Sphingomonas vulcanisoli]
MALVAAATAAPAKYRPTGADLLHKIDRLGAPAVLEDDFNLDGGPGYAVVETGSADGVAVAVKLLTTVADAAYSEGLQSSLGVALQRHPENVLPLVDSASVLAADHICLPWMIESPHQKVRDELTKTRAALDTASAKAYPAQRAACLMQIKRAEMGVR